MGRWVSDAMSQQALMFDAVQDVPPHSRESELAVIAGLLMDSAQCQDVMPILSPDDFYHAHHQAIFSAIKALDERHEMIDSASVLHEVQAQGLIKSKRVDVEYFSILRDANNVVPHALNTLKHAYIVRQHAIRRQLIAAAHELTRDAANLARDPEQVAQKTAEAIEQLQIGSSDVLSASALLPDLDRRIQERQTVGRHQEGVRSGFHDIDSLIGVFGSESLNIIAARPSMGKTAFALSLARAIAQSGPVLFISLEMTKLELMERLLVSMAQVDNRKIRGLEYLDVRDMAKILIAQEQIQNLPILIDDTAPQALARVYATIRQCQHRHQIRAVIIDYLQLLDPDEKSRDNRQEQIAKMSRRLKTLAKDRHIPIFALSQLNRAAEQREDRRPRMSDLRESGAIEQDADTVLLLHRPEYYDPNDKPGLAEVIIAKNRHGPTGTVELQFHRHLATFQDKILIPT